MVIIKREEGSLPPLLSLAKEASENMLEVSLQVYCIVAAARAVANRPAVHGRV